MASISGFSSMTVPQDVDQDPGEQERTSKRKLETKDTVQLTANRLLSKRPKLPEPSQPSTSQPSSKHSTFPMTGRCKALAISDNGGLSMHADSWGVVKILNSDKTIIKELTLETNNPLVAFSTAEFLTLLTDGSQKIYLMKSITRLKCIDIKLGPITAVACGESLSSFLTAHASNKVYHHILDNRYLKILGQEAIITQKNPIKLLGMSPNGKVAASAGEKGTCFYFKHINGKAPEVVIKTDHVVTALFLTDVYIAVGDALGHLTLYSHMGYKAATKRITLKSIQSIYMSINDTSILLGYKGELAICQYNWKEKAIMTMSYMDMGKKNVTHITATANLHKILVAMDNTIHFYTLRN